MSNQQPRIAVGDPIDPATARPLCPRCYSEGRDGCCLALEWERTRAAAEGAPDPDDAGLPLWQQVDRGWSRRYDADQRAWQRERDEHEQRAELLRRQVAELEAGNDALADELSRLERTTRQRMRDVQDRHRTELADVRQTLQDQVSTGVTLNQQRGEARQEIDRLRGLLAEALDGWEAAFSTHTPDPTGRIAEIRREAGLT